MSKMVSLVQRTVARVTPRSWELLGDLGYWLAPGTWGHKTSALRHSEAYNWNIIAPIDAPGSSVPRFTSLFDTFLRRRLPFPHSHHSSTQSSRSSHTP